MTTSAAVPLPPEDRLWRHPSEMNEEGAKQQIVLVSKPTASVGRTALIAAVAGLIGAAATMFVVLGTDHSVYWEFGPNSIAKKYRLTGAAESFTSPS